MTKPASRMQRWVIGPIAHSIWQSLLIVVTIIALGLLYLPPWRGNFAEAFWNWIDPVAGISAFVISLAILYNQARDHWEEGLEKQLTVFYLNSVDGKEIAVVKNAYLAGPSDIRQWAQQLGGQMFGHMEMDMNWDDDDPPRIICETVLGKPRFVKSYSIKLYFDFNKSSEVSLSKFKKRSFKHSHVEGDTENLPVRWIRQEKSAR